MDDTPVLLPLPTQWKIEISHNVDKTVGVHSIAHTQARGDSEGMSGANVENSLSLPHTAPTYRLKAGLNLNLLLMENSTSLPQSRYPQKK